MSKTTAVLNTRQTIVFHFVLGYKLGHSCTYRQIALNYRVYSIKATNLKLAPTSNKRPWKENSRSAHPHPQPSPPPRPIQLQQNQQKLQWTRRVDQSWLFVPYLHPTDPLFLCSYWSSFPADPTDPVFLFCTLILTIFLWRQSGRRTQAISLSDNSFADVTLWDMYEATPESSLNDLTDNERNWLGTVLLRDFPEYRHVQDIFF